MHSEITRLVTPPSGASCSCASRQALIISQPPLCRAFTREAMFGGVSVTQSHLQHLQSLSFLPQMRQYQIGPLGRCPPQVRPIAEHPGTNFYTKHSWRSIPLPSTHYPLTATPRPFLPSAHHDVILLRARVTWVTWVTGQCSRTSCQRATVLACTADLTGLTACQCMPADLR